MTDYVVIYERSENGGWGAYLPDIDGVVALGESRQVVERGIKEALEAHFEYAREEGEVTVPTPVHEAGMVRVEVPKIPA